MGLDLYQAHPSVVAVLHLCRSLGLRRADLRQQPDALDGRLAQAQPLGHDVYTGAAGHARIHSAYLFFQFILLAFE